MNPRHEGKPLLRLLDGYVMDAIGHLDPVEASALQAMEPQLRREWGGTGDWRALCAAQMRFPDGMAGAIREVWEKGRARFLASEGYEPSAEQFTRSFVDSKFPR
ncbi:hypothetical protein JW805_10365 [Roseomonas aeriglobus]|nr:hypothetical protein [Roseomonas aeriglobus]